MNPRPSLPALPFVLLGAMTLVTFAGPVVMLAVILGGPSDKWPPDRTIEWVTIGVVFALMIALFTACVSVSYWYWRGGKNSSGAEARRSKTGPTQSGAGATLSTTHRESTGR